MNAPFNSQFSRRTILKAGALTIGFAMTARTGALAQNTAQGSAARTLAPDAVEIGRAHV